MESQQQQTTPTRGRGRPPSKSQTLVQRNMEGGDNNNIMLNQRLRNETKETITKFEQTIARFQGQLTTYHDHTDRLEDRLLRIERRMAFPQTKMEEKDNAFAVSMVKSIEALESKYSKQNKSIYDMGLVQQNMSGRMTVMTNTITRLVKATGIDDQPVSNK